MFVYELGTLERITQEIAELHHQIGSFTVYLGMTQVESRTQQYDQLCNQSHIREALVRLRAAQRSSQAHPKAPRANPKRKDKV